MLRSKLFDGLKRISTPFRTRNPHPDGARRRRGFRHPRLECLERRELLSLAGWVASATGPENVAAVDLATDLEGNVYVTGDFRGTVDFARGVTIPGDPDILTSSGSSDSFAAKYRPDGSLDWVRDLGAKGVGLDKGIAVEAIGDEMDPDNVYIVAEDGGHWKLNGDDGTNWWDEHSMGVTLADVAVDPATGDVYFTGSFSGTIATSDTVSGETITVTANGFSDIFVAKANSDGLFFWVQNDGGHRSFSDGEGITVDASGNLYVTGSLKNPRKPDKTRGGSDIFVWKLDPADGSFVWTRRAGGDSGNAAQYGDAGYEITADNSGGVYVTGTLAPSESPADFGNFQIDLSSDVVSRYGFATKLDDATGDFLWATRFGGDQSNANHLGGSLDFDSTGQLYLAGTASNAGTYGSFALADPSGPSIGFLATMNASTGVFESAQRVGTTGDPGADILAFDSDDNAFMAGWLKGLDQEFLTGDVLSSTLDANGDPTYDMVLVKLEAGDLTPPGITVTPISGLVTTEGGGTDSFMVVLNKQPTADVTIGISSNDTGEGTVSVASLTFTSANWNVAQSVTVTGVDDADVDGDIAYTILTASAKGAAEYVGIDAADVSLTNLDNEAPTGNAADGADGGDPVLAGVAVSVTVTGPGSFSATLSGTTDSLGVFTSGWLSNLADGTYTATVTSISLGSFVWKAALGTNVAIHIIPQHTSSASAAASVDALDQLMAGLGGTTSSDGGDDDSEGLFGSLQDDVAINLLFA